MKQFTFWLINSAFINSDDNNTKSNQIKLQDKQTEQDHHKKTSRTHLNSKPVNVTAIHYKHIKSSRESSCWTDLSWVVSTEVSSDDQRSCLYSHVTRDNSLHTSNVKF